MRKPVIAVLVIAGLVLGFTTFSFASDWDKAGKALAIIEGVRVVTGGKVDIIGTVTGINRPYRQTAEYRERREYGHDRGYSSRRHGSYEWRNDNKCKMVWVPHYVWKEKYVPGHTEYRNGHEVVVEGHHERYLAEEGGHWEKVYTVCRR